MVARPESDFPTIAQLRDCLSTLVERGLGDHPIQILLAPDSTLQAIARSTPGHDPAKPAMMIDLEVTDGSRLPVSIISADRMSGRGSDLTTQ